MTKREGELKSVFFDLLHRARPNFVVQQMATAGSPDRSITGYGKTTHWEFKHGTPEFESLGIQELMCVRLAAAGHCRYVLWQQTHQDRGSCRTLIVHPRVIKERSNWKVVPETFCIGFNMVWLLTQILKEHGG